MLRRISKPEDIEEFPTWEAPDMDELDGKVVDLGSVGVPRCADPSCEDYGPCYRVRTANNRAWHIPLSWTKDV